MSNPGLHPIDADTPVGQLRLSLADTLFTELPGANTSVEPRQVNYANFSDGTLSSLLHDADGSTLRAKAYAYAELATIAAHRSVSIKTNDLGVTRDKTASELRELAKFWSAEADKADDAALDESLEIIRQPGHDGKDAGYLAVL